MRTFWRLLAVCTGVIVVGGLALNTVSGDNALEFGSNWTAEYYDNRDLSGSPVTTRSGINGIDFDWGNDAPIEIDEDDDDENDIDDDDFSIRFRSTQTFTTGTYEFVLSSDDGARVFIDGELVLDRFVGRPLTTDRFTRSFTTGTYSLTVEYFEAEDEASIQFQWFLLEGEAAATAVGETGGTGVVTTPGPTPIPPTVEPTGPTAEVTGVQGLAVRTAPFLDATFITTAVPGVRYSVTGRNMEEGIYPWYQVNVNGQVGWSSGRFLAFNFDPMTLPEVPSVVEESVNAPSVGITAVARSVMNMRSGPSIRAPIISSMGYNVEGELIGRTVYRTGEDAWYQVRIDTMVGPIVGWVYSEFITVRGGNIESVPIR